MSSVRTSIATSLVVAAACASIWILQAEPVPVPPQVASAPMPDAPVIPTASIAPNVITVARSTEVLFTVSIPDRTLNPASVDLLRVSVDGTSTAVAPMTDDGRNGDQKPGDRVFTARLTLNEPQAGEVKFQVSAAFRGIVRRSLSAASTLISSPLSLSLTLPPTWTVTQNRAVPPAPDHPIRQMLAIRSISGSLLLILPDGQTTYDLTDYIDEQSFDTTVDGRLARKRVFSVNGTPLLIRYEVIGVPSFPHYLIQFEVNNQGDMSSAEQIVQSLRIGR